MASVIQLNSSQLGDGVQVTSAGLQLTPTSLLNASGLNLSGRSSGPAWVPALATTVFDWANARSYFDGTIDTLANNSLNYLVTGRSQTNVIPYAGDLEAGVSWSQLGLGLSTAGVTAPDLTPTAFKVVEDASNGRHLLYALGAVPLTIIAGNTLTGIYVLKAAERGFAICSVQDSGGNNFFASVNLNTGAVATVGSGFSGKVGTATYISGASTSLGGGWWLFSITGTVDPAATGAFAGLDISDVLGANSYQGIAGDGINAWCCDVVLGATGTVPMPSIGLETTAQPTAQLLGTSWTQLPLTGLQALRLSGGVYTNAAVAGQNAGYFTVNENKGRNVRRIGADFKFTQVGAGLNGAATLAVWKTQPITTAAPPNCGCHLALGRTSWIYGKILNGQPVTPVASGAYVLGTGVPLTGLVAFDYPNSKAIVTLPDGSVQNITDPDIAAQAGPWATFEAFQNDAAADDRIGFFKGWVG